MRSRTLLLSIMIAASACTGVGVDPLGMEIVEDVTPIRPMTLTHLCVQVNSAVKPEFNDGLFELLRAQGLHTQTMQSAFAGECPHRLRYAAAWTGFPTYLQRARFEVYEGSTLLGTALYDASHGGGRPDRFGAAIGKVRPLIVGLFHHVRRDTASDTAD